jgi:hypothetical protein
VGSPVQWHEPVTIAAQNEAGDGAWPENITENRVDDGAWPEQWARGRRGRGKRQRNLNGQARRQRSRSVGSEAQREGVRRSEKGKGPGLRVMYKRFSECLLLGTRQKKLFLKILCRAPS